MRPSPVAQTLRRSLCYVLSYTLLASFLLAVPSRASKASLAPRGTTEREARPVAAHAAANQAAPRREGEVLVRFRPNTPQQRMTDAAQFNGARRKRGLRGGSRVEALELDPSLTPEVVAASLQLDPSVEFAEPNYLIAKDDLTPNDPRFAEQWALRNLGIGAGQTAGADTRAAQAWDVTTGSQQTVVAILDSGVDFTHPELVDNHWVNVRERADGRDNDRNGYADDLTGWDFVAGTGAGGDANGHGTAVAGLVAARGDNGEGVAGVMWRVRLMSLRVLDAEGVGDVGRAVEAIDYAVANGAQVINCSWGTGGASQALYDAIERASARGVVVVASAGNAGRDLDAEPYYPASYDLPNVISVAATDASDRLAPWSNYGATRVQVAAPGVQVLTTTKGGGYGQVSGTSVSVPLVSGITGLLKSVRPYLRAGRTREAIVSTARRAAGLEGKVASGGVADAEAALAAVAAWPQDAGFDLRPAESNVGGVVNHGGAGGNQVGTLDETQDGRDGRSGPPPRPGKFRRSQPNLEELRRRPSDPLRVPSPVRSHHPDYKRGEPNQVPGEAISADFVSTGRYTGSTLPVARLDPTNRTGTGGEDLFSGNYNWTLPLVSLPGRAVLDLGLALSYNSLVWTKLGSSSVYFDSDSGFPSPGFRLGFPVVQPQFYNEVTGKHAYLLLTSSGARVELRRVGTSSTYEAADSSYLQLIDYGSTKLLRTTDGTQLTFANDGAGQFKCTQVKDRNGNYLSVAYTAGRITSVTDTLGRVVEFTYDANNRLSTIRQMRAGVEYRWATFGYSNIPVQPNFPGMWVYGPYNTTLSLLTHVWTNDSALYEFTYNPFGQVYRIDRKAPAGNLLSRTTYNLPTASTAQSDCPRFTERRDWIAEWNGDDGGTHSASEESVTTFGAEAGDVQTVTMPDGTTIKEFNYASGWQRGLTYQTETWSGGVRKKWTTAAWTQDNTGHGYQLNPRVFETNVWDAEGNRRRRTVISYHASFGLPHIIEEYAANATDVLRRTYLDYKMESFYTDKRIIGLPYQRLVYDGAAHLASKTLYAYDEGGDYYSAQAPSLQYDSINYPSWYIVGRGNLTGVARMNVNAENDWGQAVWVRKTGYNMGGSPVLVEDGAGHRTNFSYADSFSDGVNRGTLAYPTSATLNDPGTYTSTAQFNFHSGALTRTQDPKGAVREMLYDSVGRLEKVRTPYNGAYTKWLYPSTFGYVQTFSTVNTAVDESYLIRMLDGAGRVISEGASHPFSLGGYKGQHFVYDVMGRLIEQTNPGEMDGWWTPFGEDAAGWRVNLQTYDWQGRPRVTTNTDATTKDLTYEGCGCAGSLVVTATDEVGRKTKTTYDVLGRLWKTEILNPNGSVYRAITNTYNTLDQVTQADDQAAGGATQLTLMTYDGHGRLKTRKYPHETYATTFNYKSDDLLESATDARGVTNVFTYNNRHLLTGVDYGTAPGVEPTADVALAYDEAGNRTQMVEAGLGQVDYVYNTLSQLTSETRQFTGLSGTFPLTYTYNLAGQLKSVTDPANATTNYNYDSEGQAHSVTASGTTYGGVTTYASAIKYRAWGSLRSLIYGNNLWLATNYDERMRVSRFEVGGQNTQYGAPSTAMLAQYSYYADGSPRLVDNGVNDIFDRAFSYDHAARLQEAFTGNEARNFINTTTGGTADGPYRQTYQHDAWGNMTGRTNRFWSQTDTLAASYTDNRRQGFGYDEAGNLQSDGLLLYSYDAAGQNRLVHDNSTIWVTQWYDGDGLAIKRHEERHDENGQPSGTTNTFYLRSSVLGGRVVSELSDAGEKQSGKVYMGVELLAEQTAVGVEWKHQDPLTGSDGSSVSGAFFTAGSEVDPTGVDVGPYDPFIFTPPAVQPEVPSLLGGFLAPSGRCTWNGMPLFCSEVPRLVGTETAVLAPQETARQVIYQGRLVMALWQAYADGYQGFVPVTARYAGGGNFRPIGSGGAPNLGSRSRNTVRDTNFPVLNGVTGNSEAQLARTPSAMLLNAGFSPHDNNAPFMSHSKPGVCSIELRISGPLSEGNDLGFFSGTQSLGPVDSQTTWGYQLEISGTVRGDASKWFLGRRVSSRIWGESFDHSRNEAFTYGPHDLIDEPDNPTPVLSMQKPAGQSTFFAVDAPGIPKLRGYTRISAILVQNFFAYIERGNNRCSIKYTVLTVVKDNRAESQLVFPGHPFPLKHLGGRR